MMHTKTSLALGSLFLSTALVGAALADKGGAPAAPAAPAAKGAPAAPAAPVAAMAKMAITAAADLKWQPLDPKNPGGLQTSMVHGDMFKGPAAFFLKLPAGAKSGLHAHTNDYYGIAISGQPGHGNDEKEASKAMAIGSMWFQPGKAMHADNCNGKKECVILLIYPGGGFDYIPGPAAEPAKGKGEGKGEGKGAGKGDGKGAGKDEAAKPAK